jgi:cytochrome c-type biogenesis protein CcmE
MLFWLFLVVVIMIASLLILYALRQNISLFYTPTQFVESDIELLKKSGSKTIRVGGLVVPGSIARHDLDVRFKLTDYQQTIEVVYHGILPDLFREGQGIVAQGQVIDHQHLQALIVLAKHDEKYMPPEIRDTLNHSTKTGAA